MRQLSNIISYIFHPLFILSYVLFLLILINPYLFAAQDEKVRGLLIFSVFSLSLLFPLIAIFMMKGLGLIESLHMKDKKERIGPMIVTIIFYMWLYINLRNNFFVPDALRFFLLGSTISLCLAFVLNTMTKISLHTVGMGGFLMGFILIRFNFSYETFAINLMGNVFEVSSNLILYLIILAAGAVGTARLLLKAHNADEVYGGYFIGVIGMVVSYLFLLRG